MERVCTPHELTEASTHQRITVQEVYYRRKSTVNFQDFAFVCRFDLELVLFRLEEVGVEADSFCNKHNSNRPYHAATEGLARITIGCPLILS